MSARCLLGCALASFGVVSTLTAQIFMTPGGPVSPPQAYSGPRYTVGGSVIDSASSAPVQRAIVEVSTAAGQMHGFTGADGRFELDNVPAGNLVFSARKPGYNEFPGARSANLARTTVHLTANVSDVTIRLTPESKMHGKVMDRDGEPVENVHIEALSEQIINGRKSWRITGQASTADDGAYRIEGLPSGSYLLRAAMTIVPRTAASLYAQVGKAAVTSGDKTDYRPEVFPTQYFPDANDRTQAQLLSLNPGDDPELDFRVSPVRAYTIRGTAQGVQGANGSCETQDGEQLGAGVRNNPRTGEFMLSPIPPGTCTLRLRGGDSHGQSLYAEAVIEIAGADVNNVRLQFEPVQSIPLVVETTLPQVTVQGQLLARSTGDAHTGGRGRSVTPDAIGAFKNTADPNAPSVFRDVIPGVYHVSAQIFPSGCAESIVAGGLDLRRQDLAVSPGAQPPPIVVTATDNCGEVSGTVRQNASGATGVALLAPVNESNDVQLAGFGPNGSFSFHRLPPGDYRVYAFPDVNELEYANPEVMRQFPGQTIHVAAKETAQVQVDMAERPE